VAGLVTLEDVLEELVGEIEDEYDPDEPELVPVSDGVYRVDGAMTVHDLGELLGVELPSEEWDTVGGLMLGLLGAIPKEGQEVRYQNLVFRAEKGRRPARPEAREGRGAATSPEDVGLTARRADERVRAT